MSVGTPGAIRVPPPDAGPLGQGISYPLSLDNRGRLNLAWGAQLVEQSLQAIWETAPGERVMLPKFGAAVGEFEPIDLFRLVQRFKQNVTEYEPRVDKCDVDVKPGPDTNQAFAIVSYVLKGEANERTLTFPYFTGAP